MFTVQYNAIDGYRDYRHFKTLRGARAYAHARVGANAEVFGGYAVSEDGVGKVTCGGCPITHLFPQVEPARPALPHNEWDPE